MKVKLTLAALLVLAATPAFAQMPSLSIPSGNRQLTPEETEKEERIDRAYRATNKAIPDQKGSVDPWGNVRQSTPAPAQKPAGTAANKTTSAKPKPTTNQ